MSLPDLKTKKEVVANQCNTDLEKEVVANQCNTDLEKEVVANQCNTDLEKEMVANQCNTDLEIYYLDRSFWLKFKYFKLFFNENYGRKL